MIDTGGRRKDMEEEGIDRRKDGWREKEEEKEGKKKQK